MNAVARRLLDCANTARVIADVTRCDCTRAGEPYSEVCSHGDAPPSCSCAGGISPTCPCHQFYRRSIP